MDVAVVGQIIAGATSVALLALAAYAAGNLRFRVPGSGFFVALTVAGAVWSLGFVVEYAQSTLEGFALAAKLEYLGLVYVPTLWLLVALSWMEQPAARSVTLRWLLLGASTLWLVLVWTNEQHHLWYSAIVPTGRTGFATYEPGPLYRPLVAVYLLTFVLSSVILLVRRKSVPLFRRKAVIILGTNAIPFVFTLAYQAGYRPWGLDLTVLSLIPTFVLLAWGLYRQDLLRIAPIARDTVLESMEQAVLVLDAGGEVADYNSAARPLLKHFEQALRDQPDPRGEITVTTAHDTRTFRFRRSPIRTVLGHDRGSVVLLTDTTDEKRLITELAHQASHDSLTGLSNRRWFEETALGEVDRCLRNGGTMALVLFDLDLFKTINDRFGHQAGDRVLKLSTSVVATRLRPYDLLARIGGEEFAVLMPQATAAEAREAAERWRAALEASPQVFPGGTAVVTASFGVADLASVGASVPPLARPRLDALLVLADKALYRAKKAGRNRVC